MRNPGCQRFWIPAPRFRGDKFTPAKAGYLFSQGKAIPIPIYDNRDEAATK